ncbi:MAG: hypothetical protein U0746_21570 [Gemmataceae bacterium]
MSEPTQIDLVRKAILAGTLGNIQWKDSAAAIVRQDATLMGLTPQGIRKLVRELVAAGTAIDVREEKRAEYRAEHPFWFRIMFDVPDLFPRLFVEIILVDDDPEEPFVEIVSAHR